MRRRYLNVTTYLTQKLHSVSGGNDIDTICERRLGWKTIQTVLRQCSSVMDLELIVCTAAMYERTIAFDTNWKSGKRFVACDDMEQQDVHGQ